jgi:hypothetical protein
MIESLSGSERPNSLLMKGNQQGKDLAHSLNEEEIWLSSFPQSCLDETTRKMRRGKDAH